MALSKNRSEKEYRDALGECVAISKNMQTMVESLLLLARLDAGQIRLRSEPVSLSELLRLSWRQYAEKADSRNISFQESVPPDLSFPSSHEILSMVFSSLFSNAVEYAEEGGKVWVTGRASQQYVEITVANTGCQLKEDDLSHLFDRFWRKDGARAGTGMHSGLGLTLVQRSVDALGGKAEVSLESSGVFTVKLVLPI